MSAPNIVRRSIVRKLGVFVDGPALDRACKRMDRRIDLKALVKVVSSGLPPHVLRYYTLLPDEDDSRHRSFLNAVGGAGFEPVIKRLPPKGVNRMVSIDVEMATDLTMFGQEAKRLPNYTNDYEPELDFSNTENDSDVASATSAPAVASVVAICPNRELFYPLSILRQNKIEVTVADFLKPGNSELIKVCKRWVDLSESEVIWI